MASMLILTTGVVYIRGGVNFGSLSSPISNGYFTTVHVANNSGVASRNAANSSDIYIGYIDTSNRLVLGYPAAHIVPGTDGVQDLGTTGARFRQLVLSGSAIATTYRLNGDSGAATTSLRTITKVTGIADNTATTVFTLTVPNGNHAAAVYLTFLSSNGSTDAFESNRTATGLVVVQRNTGASAVATAAAISNAAIATVGGGATHTLAYSVVANAEGVGSTETVSIKVTIDDSGNLGSNQVVVLAELVNAEASGVTIA